MKKAVYINRDNGGDRSTVAVLHVLPGQSPQEVRDLAAELALEACQRCNGGVQFYASRRPCRHIAGPVESGRFIASMSYRRKES